MRIGCAVLVAAVGVATASGQPACAAHPRYPLAEVAPKFRALAAIKPVCVATALLPALAPEPDSAATAAEIAVLLALQATRTAADVAAIRAEAGDVLPLFLVRAGIDPRRTPHTHTWLRRALNDLDAVLFAHKLRMLRPRPHQADARVQPAIAVPRHPAYPSGHGGEARLIARLLSVVAPARQADLLQYAAQVGWRREQAGVHFGSDTAAGARLGDAVAEVWLSQSACVARWLQSARAEWSEAATGR